jgi:hypothetical protein
MQSTKPAEHLTNHPSHRTEFPASKPGTAQERTVTVEG